ncbi:unnamed protein product [Paramecium pentaurelia]|uniref:Tetratricopeptide repeat protein n=1 Tax=Paramecium pentaurelia TaxID=43138 RepID=A0A8S1XAA8_9CILI|nr:unnamed protein product [Paramecium pentaurelia]
MIQQANLKLKCQVDEHKEEIDFICFDQFCSGIRLQFVECFKRGIDNNHINDIKKVNTLIQFLENNNKDCDNLIDDLNKCVENVNQSFSQLKRGIRKKYSLFQERLVNLNSCQINDYLNSTIQFTEYKQSITKIIEEQTKKLTHSFNNLYEQLQLSQFNYYQVDEHDIKLSEDLYQQGYQLYWEDKYNEGIEQLDKSISINPNNQFLKQYDISLTYLHQALLINPNHTFSLDRIGNCLQDQEKYLEALIYYERKLKIQPNDQWTKNQKEFCEEKLKN